MEEGTALERERRAKVARWRSEGREPYPWSYPGRVVTEAVRASASRLRPGESEASSTFRVAGRLRSVRRHGQVAFLDLEDAAGSLQILLRADLLGEDAYRTWLADLDPGDIVGADGAPAVSKRGEPSLEARTLTLLAKAISPPPEKYHGLQDTEERIRRPYLDLLISPESRARARLRSLLEQEARSYFVSAGFTEVETPVLLPVAGGAAAAPFVTRSNYAGADLQLRIALELPLKKLLVGGLEKVFELGKVFRNEDLDSTHSPEFTELEAYWAYADYHDMGTLFEGLLARLVQRAEALLPDGPVRTKVAEVFRPPFRTLDFVEELERASGLKDVAAMGRDELRAVARRVGSTVPDSSPAGTFLDKLFEHFVEPTIEGLTFVVDHPASTTPLAKSHRSKPGRVERFEVFVPGFELANAYTELNDPDEQARRFEEQARSVGGDRYVPDPDFVRALRYGLPPCTGIGFGVDRLVMALTGAASIKDVILFPIARPRSE
jgi:lysyl-tRNA synthetase, class II